jgi:4-hydroxy-tetrahydrodipicolinate synthase
MSITVRDLAGRLFPAVPVPFDAAGAIHDAALERYAAWMANQPIGGVAVWAHTGRGLRVTDIVRERVLKTWRRALPAESVIIAAAGASPGRQSPAEVIASARAMAAHAANLGAGAILVHPPASLLDHPDRDALILDYHARIAEAGLPQVVFYLYEAAGGISYSMEVLAQLLDRPDVLGVKVATLDSVMTFQHIAWLVRNHPAEKLLITGEDRFLGYSLMCGAQAALIGMAAACTREQAELLEAYWHGRSQQFLALSAAVDQLAESTFTAPIEGYIRRMLWCLVHQGVIPIEAAHDPWGPPLEMSEFERIGVAVARLESDSAVCRAHPRAIDAD